MKNIKNWGKRLKKIDYESKDMKRNEGTASKKGKCL